MAADAYLPGNDFLIRPSEVSENQLRFKVTLAPRPDRFDRFPKESPVQVEVVVTPEEGDAKTVVVKLEPVGQKFKLRKIDLWEEYQKALDPDAITGYVLPEYRWWTEWPSGKAEITHLSGEQIVEWEPRLKRGTELRIDFPVSTQGQGIATMESSAGQRRQLVLYVEAPLTKAQQEQPDVLKSVGETPLRTSTKIQGNILAGFNKDHQVFLFLTFNDAGQAREWVSGLIPSNESTEGRITMTAEVTSFKDKRQVKDPVAEYITSLWLNLSFTFPGIKKLQPELAAQLEAKELFEAFRGGAKGRDIFGKDEEESSPRHWVLTDDVHALLTIAADDPDELGRVVTEHLGRAASCGITVRYQQRGDALPGPMPGREHFGFKDGVSQPGVRGYTRPAQRDPDEDADHPGARIVAAEHFLLAPGDDDLDWMADGSFQTFVRFTQDVCKWSIQVRYWAQNLPLSDVMSPELLAAKLIGRWPSGTPIDLAPRRDDRPNISVGDNDFKFANDAPGKRCPKFAHIRTQNPRTGADDDEPRILRRGIPFGPVYDPAEDADGGYARYNDRERGLCFNAFMANIEDQFEFLYDKALAATGDPVASGKQGAYDLRLPDDGVKENRRTLDLRGYVVNTLTLYAFAPSLDGLRRLAQGEDAPA